MKITKSQLKEIIKEEVESNSELIDAINSLSDTIADLDISIDFLSSAVTGETASSLSGQQRGLGRFATPKVREKPAIDEKTHTENTHMKITKQYLKQIIKEELDALQEKDLSAKERRDLPDSDFALPGKGEGPEGKQAGSYPIPDEEHARMALAMVAKHGTSEEKAKVRAAVKRKFPNIEQGE